MASRTLSVFPCAGDSAEFTDSISVLVLKFIAVTIKSVLCIALLVLFALGTPWRGRCKIAFAVLDRLTFRIFTGRFTRVFPAAEFKDITGNRCTAVFKTVEFYTLLVFTFVSGPAILRRTALVTHTHICIRVTITRETAGRIGETPLGAVVIFIAYLNNTSALLAKPLPRKSQFAKHRITVRIQCAGLVAFAVEMTYRLCR